MSRLRKILREEYIGAIAIGFLLAQAIGGIIGVILQPIIDYFENRGRPQSIFAPQHSSFNWPSFILNVISILLHLLAASLLYYWLYVKKSPETVVAVHSPVTDDDSEGPHE